MTMPLVLEVNKDIGMNRANETIDQIEIKDCQYDISRGSHVTRVA